MYKVSLTHKIIPEGIVLSDYRSLNNVIVLYIVLLVIKALTIKFLKNLIVYGSSSVVW